MLTEIVGIRVTNVTNWLVDSVSGALLVGMR